MNILECAPIIQNNLNNNKLSIKNIKKLNKNTFKNKKLKYKAFDGTCYSYEDLLRLVREWNLLNHNNKIIIKKNVDSKEIWNSLKEKMINCNSEYCWLDNIEKMSGKKKSIEELKNNFRPEMPDEWHYKNTEWLSSLDIENVLFQYDDEFPEFKFMGAIPIDFNEKISETGSCVSNNMCNFNLKKLKNQGKTKIGIVFNLDKHNESGSHWIAMYLDLNRKDLGYWDSYGYEPPNEVIEFINKVQNQSNKYWKCKFKEYINKTRHQYKNSECGMYCINFIVQLLEGNKYLKVFKNIINDDIMNSYREKYFNKYLKK